MSVQPSQDHILRESRDSSICDSKISKNFLGTWLVKRRTSLAVRNSDSVKPKKNKSIESHGILAAAMDKMTGVLKSNTMTARMFPRFVKRYFRADTSVKAICYSQYRADTFDGHYKFIPFDDITSAIEILDPIRINSAMPNFVYGFEIRTKKLVLELWSDNVQTKCQWVEFLTNILSRRDISIPSQLQYETIGAPQKSPHTRISEQNKISKNVLSTAIEEPDNQEEWNDQGDCVLTNPMFPEVTDTEPGLWTTDTNVGTADTLRETPSSDVIKTRNRRSSYSSGAHSEIRFKAENDAYSHSDSEDIVGPMRRRSAWRSKSAAKETEDGLVELNLDMVDIDKNSSVPDRRVRRR